MLGTSLQGFRALRDLRGPICVCIKCDRVERPVKNNPTCNSGPHPPNGPNVHMTYGLSFSELANGVPPLYRYCLHSLQLKPLAGYQSKPGTGGAYQQHLQKSNGGYPRLVSSDGNPLLCCNYRCSDYICALEALLGVGSKWE